MRSGVRGFSPAALRAARAAADLRTDELAHLLGVTRQAVGNWENGTAKPGPPTLVELATALRVQPGDLVPIREADLQIGDLRALAGLTQVQAARATGIAVGALAEIERGLKAVDAARAKALATAYGVPVERLAAVWQRAHAATATRLRSR